MAPSGRLLAILLIEAMPFFALQEETLQTLNLMLGYYADSLAAAPLVAQIRDPWPSCPSPFALELQRLTRLRRESAVPSALIALQFFAGKSAEDLSLVAPGFFERENFVLRLNAKAVSIDRAARLLRRVRRAPRAGIDAIDRGQPRRPAAGS